MRPAAIVLAGRRIVPVRGQQARRRARRPPGPRARAAGGRGRREPDRAGRRPGRPGAVAAGRPRRRTWCWPGMPSPTADRSPASRPGSRRSPRSRAQSMSRSWSQATCPPSCRPCWSSSPGRWRGPVAGRRLPGGGPAVAAAGRRPTLGRGSRGGRPPGRGSPEPPGPPRRRPDRRRAGRATGAPSTPTASPCATWTRPATSQGVDRALS